MNFFGYPVEIWLASFVAVMLKLKKTSSWSIVGTISTISIALFSGLVLYGPIITIMELPPTWSVPVAILSALTAENFMNNIVDISDDSDFIKDWLRFFLTRKIENDDKDGEDPVDDATKSQ